LWLRWPGVDLTVRRNEQLEHWLWWLEHFVDGGKEFRKEKKTNSSNDTIIEFDFCLFSEKNSGVIFENHPSE
jgi:hypothetical protein